MQCGQWSRTGQLTLRSSNQVGRKVQLGVGAGGDLREVMDLLLERMEGKVEVHWVRGREDKRTTRRMTSKHQRGQFNLLGYKEDGPTVCVV